MREFECRACNKIFKARGLRMEEMHPIYGKIWHWQAKHECGNICLEYFPPKVKSKKKPKQACSGNCHSCPYQ